MSNMPIIHPDQQKQKFRGLNICSTLAKCYLKPVAAFRNPLAREEIVMKDNSISVAKLLATLTALFFCLPAMADKESDWIELREGYREKIIGARVDQIDEIKGSEGNANTQVTLAIPKAAIEDTDDILEIVVVGKAPKKEDKPVTLNIHHEWANDYENDYYGLILTIGDFTELPIRLYFKGDTTAP